MNVSELYDFDMTKVMYGIHAVHAPIWMVVQNQRDATLLAGASKSMAPMYGSEHIHALILGEMIIRPHFVCASSAFAGRGAGGFWTDPLSISEWIDSGEVIIDTLKIGGKL